MYSTGALAIALFFGCQSCQLPPHSWAGERERFPSQMECDRAIEFNQAFRQHIQARLAEEEYSLRPNYDRISFLHRAMAEAWDSHYAYWILSLNSDRERELAREQPEASWRGWLAALRQKLGEEAYAAGRMPPAAPEWAFHFIDP
jgi:hypothetical protein